MSDYKSRAARDAEEMIGSTRFMTRSYADYIESQALEHAEQQPHRAYEFMNRSLGEALRGNDGI